MALCREFPELHATCLGDSPMCLGGSSRVVSADPRIMFGGLYCVFRCSPSVFLGHPQHNNMLLLLLSQTERAVATAYYFPGER